MSECPLLCCNYLYCHSGVILKGTLFVYNNIDKDETIHSGVLSKSTLTVLESSVGVLSFASGFIAED